MCLCLRLFFFFLCNYLLRINLQQRAPKSKTINMLFPSHDLFAKPCPEEKEVHVIVQCKVLLPGDFVSFGQNHCF